MKEIKLKDYIFIKCCDGKEALDVEWSNHMWWDNYRGRKNYKLLYLGKFSDITEEEAQKYVNSMQGKGGKVFYEEYDPDFDEYEFSMQTALESLHTVCQKEYCIIYSNEIL